MATAPLTPKPKGRGLEMRTFTGSSGKTYLVLKTLDGGFHVFAEVEAKEAANDCGAARGSTRQEWGQLWGVD